MNEISRLHHDIKTACELTFTIAATADTDEFSPRTAAASLNELRVLLQSIQRRKALFIHFAGAMQRLYGQSICFRKYNSLHEKAVAELGTFVVNAGDGGDSEAVAMAVIGCQFAGWGDEEALYESLAQLGAEAAGAISTTSTVNTHDDVPVNSASNGDTDRNTSLESKAMAIYVDHACDISQAAIARKLGIQRQGLSKARCPRLHALIAAYQRDQPPRGSKSADSKLEAFDTR